MMRYLWVVVVVCLVACGGDAPDNLARGAASLSLSGRVTYEFVPPHTESAGTGADKGLDYARTRVLPVRGAKVELLDRDGRVLDEAQTDDNGHYRFAVEADVEVRVRVRAELSRRGKPGWDLRVLDNTRDGALYVLDGRLRSSGNRDSRRDLHAGSGWTGDAYTQARAAGPFAILDCLYGAMQRLLESAPKQVFPPLRVYWSPDNRPAIGNKALGEIGTTYYQNGEIFLLGAEDADTDEFDRHVILHEWGHFLEDALYRTDTLGGRHSRHHYLDMRVAMSEGFANAVSSMMLDNPVYRDTSGTAQNWASTFSLNRSADTGGLPRGWYSAASVGELLYGYYRSEENGRDFAVFHQVLSSQSYRTADALTSIYLFIAHFEQVRPQGLAPFLEAQDIQGRGFLGAGEVNDGGLEESLPIYKRVAPDNQAVRVCSFQSHGQHNKLVNRQYLVLDIQTEGTYVVRLEADASPRADLGFALIDKGSTQVQSQARQAASLQRRVKLTAGRYILEVFDWRNLDVATEGSDLCMDVSVSH